MRAVYNRAWVAAQLPTVLDTVDIPGVGARQVRVYVPPSPSQEPVVRPLLVLWDGQNVFEDAPSFAGGWHVQRAVARRGLQGKVAPVVVGIDHGGPLRMQELAPWPPAGDSLSQPLMDYVCDIFVPKLQQEYALVPAPEGVVVGGSSLGGLMALWCHLQRPDVFGGALAMSPSIFLGNGGLGKLAAVTPKPWRTQIYLDAGGREAGGRLAQACQALATLLTQRGWNSQELWYREVKRGQHNEKHWGARMPAALKFLYGV